MLGVSTYNIAQQATSNKEQATSFAKVAIDLPILSNTDDCFYYSIPEELKEEIKIGSVVRVPFGKQELIGFIVEISYEVPAFAGIKPIYEIVYKNPFWDKKFIDFARWISSYYFTNLGTVLSAGISSDLFNQLVNEVELLNTNEDPRLRADEQSLSKEEYFIVGKLLKSKKKILSYRTLQHKIKFSKQKFYQVIRQLENKNIIKKKVRILNKEVKSKKQKADIKNSELRIQNSEFRTHLLNTDQQNAYNTILKSINNNEHKQFLLHGVTGSGKTEVYLRLIEKVLEKNKSVIYLVPEIYLVPQILERLKEKFPKEEIILWHSSINKNDRLNNFRNLEKSNSKIILGARSAILSPIKNIGLIVIDEAHESSYKQSAPAPRYDAVTLAKKRSQLENCLLILGTATPNISDYYLSLQEKTLLELPKRIHDFPMPKVTIVNMKDEYSKTSKIIISSLLKANINEALRKKEQIILLLNRRGYSSHVFCRICGFIQYCKNCSVPMVYHKNFNLLICHHCGNKSSIQQCPECKSPHFKHFGIGTQQLEEEIKKIFSTAKTIRVDSDQLKRKDEYIKLWQSFSKGEADILIGTQIVAKGLDLPNVTVVGVILADAMFHFPDYVSTERAFQLLTQVTGRAGRGNKLGKVFIQTYDSENQLLQYIENHSYKDFYTKELEERKNHLYPPFCNLTRIIFQSLEEKECIDYANKTLTQLSTPQLASSPVRQFAFLGPAPCFFSKLQNKYRYHILCKLSNEETKIFVFNNLFQNLKKNAKVELIVDVNSVNLL